MSVSHFTSTVFWTFQVNEKHYHSQAAPLLPPFFLNIKHWLSCTVFYPNLFRAWGLFRWPESNYSGQWFLFARSVANFLVFPAITREPASSASELFLLLSFLNSSICSVSCWASNKLNGCVGKRYSTFQELPARFECNSVCECLRCLYPDGKQQERFLAFGSP